MHFGNKRTCMVAVLVAQPWPPNPAGIEPKANAGKYRVQLLVVRHRPHHFMTPCRPQVVMVEKCDEFSDRRGEADIARRRGAAPDSIQETDAGISDARDYGPGTVGRGIIDN